MKLKTYLKSAIAGFTAFAMAVTMFPAAGLEHVQAASTDENMVLHWDMTINDDGSLKDVTANGHDGIITAPVESGKIDNIDIVDLKGGYVDIPDGTINSDMTEVTINMLVNITKNVKSSWMFCLGSSNTKYLYFTACSNQNEHLRGGIGYGSPGYSHEADIGGDSSLDANKWQNITVTYKDNEKFTFYKDGVFQAETNAIVADKTGNYTLQDLMTAGDSRDGYMGWSFYGGKDPKFEGKVADFRIYNKAMSQAEVTALQSDIDNMLNSLSENDFSESDIDLTEEDCLGENTSKNSVTKNLVLPEKTTLNGSAEKEAVITEWESSDPSVIAADGTVTRADTDKTVSLTASVTRNNVTVKKTLTFRVPLLISDDAAVSFDKEALIIPNSDDIRGNISLPSAGAKGSAITWTSSNEDVISTKAQGAILPGAVTRSASDVSVKLTATITSNAVKDTKEFNCTVKKAYTMPETTDYLFAYFPYAGVKDERIYFGISQDGLNFSALNDGKFILESTLGTHGLRDPFIIRSPEGDRFYLIATDLTVAGLEQNGIKYPGQNWEENQKNGSQKIMVWESTDLINWSEQRECKVAADDAGCTWAPEAYWDDSTGQYVVFWASKTSVDNYSKQRVFYATTRDFYTFSEAQVWIEAPGSVIDTTVIKAGEYYYRYTKNEAGNTINGTPSKRVYCERSKSLTSANWERVHNNSLPYSGGQIEGACIFKLNKDDVENAKSIAALKNITLSGEDIFCLIADATGVTIFPGLSDDITTGNFHILGEKKVETVNGVTLYTMPEPAASHGTIMPITTEEFNNLKLQDDIRKKVGEAAAEITLEPIVVSDLPLPATASNGAEITWQTSDETLISNTGTVSRPKDADAEVTLTATITVKGNEIVPDAVTEKVFSLTVKKASGNTEELNELADAAVKELTLNTSYVTSDITLPSAASNGALISWKSSNESVISSTGKVSRPANADTQVILTATITVKGTETADDVIRTKEFIITVAKAETIPQPVSKFTVTFDSKGGSAVNAVIVENGKSITEPKTAKKNYTFAGWYNGSTKYNFSTPVTANLTLTAKWTKVTVSTPKTPALKNTKGKLTITVKKVTGAAGYQFTYSTDKKFRKGKTTTKTITKNTLTIKKPKKGKTYYVKVKAYKKDSAKKNVFSKFSKVKKIKIKK